MRWLTLLLFLLAFPASAAASFPGQNGPIVFDVAGIVARVEPDGTGLQEITDPDEADEEGGNAYGDVTASADGTRLAFTLYGDAAPTLGTTQLDADPAFAPIVDTHRDTRTPAFLPDGRVVYTCCGGPNAQIWTVNADGSYPTQESSFPNNTVPFAPIPSPEGGTVYYTAQRSYSENGTSRTDRAIRSFRFLDNADVEITPWVRDQDIRPLDVSPDGGKLLYAVTASGTETMREVDLVGAGHPTRLIKSVPVAAASYSPDGTSIAYFRRIIGEELFDLHIAEVANLANDRQVPVPLTDSTPGSLEWAVPSGITVTQTGDGTDTTPDDGVCDGKPDAGTQCTLRAAIQTANGTGKPGPDTIRFDVGTAGAQTLTLTSKLPAITEKVVIDGSTQPHPEALAGPPIALDGTGAGAGADGLVVEAEDSVIRGLDIHSFRGTGIALKGDGGVVEGNWIGFKRAGVAWETAGNVSGVDVTASGTRIGGTDPKQRNVIAANGNSDGLRDYLEGLNGDVDQVTAHGVFRSLGTGIVISDGSITGATIKGNYLGTDPSGRRFGETTGLTSTFGVFIGPDADSGGGITRDITVADNVISGNIMGVIAMPAGPGAAVVDGVDITDNIIGARPDKTADTGFGGIIGVSISNHVADVDVTGNTIQGQAIGLTAEEAAVRIQRNTIGTDGTLGNLIESVKATENPSLGLHNMIGVVLSATDGARLGGSGDLGNAILGNLVGGIVVGQGSRGNAVLGNTFGSAGTPSYPDADTGKDLSSIIGLIVDGGTDNDVGDAGAGNTFTNNGIGMIAAGTKGGHLHANRFGGSWFGLFTVANEDLVIGGTASEGNAFSSNALGAGLIAWAPTASEFAKFKVAESAPVKEDDRNLAFTAPAAAGAVNFVDDTTPADLDEDALGLGQPPGDGVAARRRRASTGSEVRTNTFDANGVGLWMGGSHVGSTVERNTVTSSYGGGVWVGTPSYFGSSTTAPASVTLRSNRIWNNYRVGFNSPGIDALGFDLLEAQTVANADLAYGVGANDPLDSDSGPNGLQNHPDVLSVQSSRGSTVASGSLASKPSTAYTIELFANERCNAFGAGEGQTPLGTAAVTTDGSGNATFLVPVTLPAGQEKVSATATGPEGTSEFSACQTVVAVDPQPSATPSASPSATATPVRTPTPDTTDPKGAVKGGKGPKAGDPITVTVTSNEDGTVAASGSIASSSPGSKRAFVAKKVKVALKRTRTAIKAGQTKRLKLKPTGKKAIRTLRKAVRKGAKATATVKVVFTDLAGNTTTKTVKVKLRK